MKKLPKKIYVAQENMGTREECLIAEKDAGKLADVGEVIVAGVYELKEVVEISAVPQTRVIGGKS